VSFGLGIFKASVLFDNSTLLLRSGATSTEQLKRTCRVTLSKSSACSSTPISFFSVTS